jgi:SNF2 family DNA or RNA helicase
MWRAVAPNEKHVQNVPGLKHWQDGNVTGPLDALAVVCKRAGYTPPVYPGISYAEASLPKLDMEPRSYQKDGVLWLASHLHQEGAALLADDMGLGKTMQTLTTWQLLKRPQLLVVCPASVRETWRRECLKWAGTSAQLVTTGKQALAMNTSAAITVTSYELAGKLPDVYSPSMLVLDEAHLLRGRGAQRSRKLLALGQECNFRLALTGTPMWSRPRDLWMLLRILFPKYRFGSAEDFDYAYCGAFINQWGGRVNKGATRSDELKLRLGYVQLRRTKEQVATEMPKLQRNVRWVPGTVPAKRAFEAALMKRMSMYDALDATLEAKLDVAVETAIEAQRFLLFTWQKRHAHELWRRLNEDDTPCVLITGDLSHAERNAAIADATARKMGVVATIDSCGTGVDGLQHVASIGIFHALDYVPIKLAQAEARLHRIGQLNPVQWVYVAMEGTADQLVAETIVEKLDQWRGVMGKDSSTGLGDAISMQDIAVDERAALKALYAAMGE